MKSKETKSSNLSLTSPLSTPEGIKKYSEEINKYLNDDIIQDEQEGKYKYEYIYINYIS
jgi:hypothetical protein